MGVTAFICKHTTRSSSAYAAPDTITYAQRQLETDCYTV